MEGEGVRLEVTLADELGVERAVASGVRPEAHSAIGRARGNELLLDADIEAVDLLGMERRNEMFVFLVIIRTFCVELRHLHDLVVASRKDDSILTRAKRDGLNRLDVNILVDEAQLGLVFLAHVVFLGGEKIIGRVNPHIRLLRIDVTLNEDAEPSALTSDDEAALCSAVVATATSGSSTAASSCCATSRARTVDGTHAAHGAKAAENSDGHDGERIFARVRDGNSLVLTCRVEEHNLTVVVADDKAAGNVVEPGVARVIRRVMLLTLALVDLSVDQLEVRAIKFIVAIQIVASHNYDTRVDGAETDLCDRAVLRWEQVDHVEHALLVPVPDDELRLALCRDSDQVAVVLGAEISANKLLGRVLVGAKNATALQRNIEDRDATLLSGQLEQLANAVDGADGIGGLLAHGEELAVGGERKGRDALRALNTRNESLHLLADVVDDDVVTAGVRDHVVFKVEDIVLHVALQTEEEAGLDVDIARRGGSLLLGKSRPLLACTRHCLNHLI